jgi:membrane protease YdiL (CAAX protease family)
MRLDVEWESPVQYSVQPAGLRALATAATRVVLGALAIAVPAFGLQLLAQRLTDAPYAARAALIIASAAAALAAYVLFVRHVERRRLSEFAADRCLPELTTGLLLGGVLFSATAGVLALCGALRITGSAPATVLLQPLISAIAAGVIEELLFRGVLLRILEAAVGSWLALALSAAVFGGFHLVAPHASVASTIAIMLEAGVLLGSAYYVTRRLWLPIGLHIGWNFTQGGVFGIAVSGHPSTGLWQAVLSGPSWLSGGLFGAEASVVAIAICLFAALLLLAIAARRGQLHSSPWSIRAATAEPSSAQSRL